MELAIFGFSLSAILLLLLLQTLSVSAYNRNTVEEKPIQIEIDSQFLNLTEGEQRTVSCTVNRGPVFFFQSPLVFVHVPKTCAHPNGAHRCRDRVMATNGLLYEGLPEFYDVNVHMSDGQTVFIFVYRRARNEDRGELRCQLLRGEDQVSNSIEVEVEEPGQRNTSTVV